MLKKKFFFTKLFINIRMLQKKLSRMNRVSMRPGIGHFFKEITSEQPKIPAKKIFFSIFFLNVTNIFYSCKIDPNVCLDSYPSIFNNIMVQKMQLFIPK